MKTNIELIEEMIEEINSWIEEDDGTWEKVTDFREVTEGKYGETRKNLFAELKKIADAVKEHDGAWYNGNNKKLEVSGLIVHHQGCIGAILKDVPVYTVNTIRVNRKGEARISEWAIDNIDVRETWKDLLDPEKRMFPAFMFYDIETGRYIIKNTGSMLKEYQRTLDGDDNIAPVASGNAFDRIGGKFYGMSISEAMNVIKAS